MKVNHIYTLLYLIHIVILVNIIIRNSLGYQFLSFCNKIAIKEENDKNKFY